MRFAKAEIATMQEVFGNVVAIGPPAALDGRSSANIVLVASQREIDVGAMVSAVNANGDGDRVLDADATDDFAGHAKVLRDDFAPVDQYIQSSG